MDNFLKILLRLVYRVSIYMYCFEATLYIVYTITHKVYREL